MFRIGLTIILFAIFSLLNLGFTEEKEIPPGPHLLLQDSIEQRTEIQCYFKRETIKRAQDISGVSLDTTKFDKSYRKSFMMR
jgi:hypothetical protein